MLMVKYIRMTGFVCKEMTQEPEKIGQKNIVILFPFLTGDISGHIVQKLGILFVVHEAANGGQRASSCDNTAKE